MMTTGFQIISSRHRRSHRRSACAVSSVTTSGTPSSWTMFTSQHPSSTLTHHAYIHHRGINVHTSQAESLLHWCGVMCCCLQIKTWYQKEWIKRQFTNGRKWEKGLYDKVKQKPSRRAVTDHPFIAVSVLVSRGRQGRGHHSELPCATMVTSIGAPQGSSIVMPCW